MKKPNVSDYDFPSDEYIQDLEWYVDHLEAKHHKSQERFRLFLTEMEFEKVDQIVSELPEQDLKLLAHLTKSKITDLAKFVEINSDHWIETSDELPKPDRYYYVYANHFGESHKFVCKAYKDRNGFYTDDDCLVKLQVSHWQVIRLPQPPKPE